MEIVQAFIKSLVTLPDDEDVNHKSRDTFTSDRRCIQNLLNRIIEVVLEFRDRDMYDRLSIGYIKSGVLPVLVRAIMNAKTIVESEYSPVARIFELCACHTQGI